MTNCPYCGLRLNEYAAGQQIMPLVMPGQIPPPPGGPVTREKTYVCNTTQPIGCGRQYAEKQLKRIKKERLIYTAISFGIGGVFLYLFTTFGSWLGGALAFVGLILLGVEFLLAWFGYLSERPAELNPALMKVMLRVAEVILLALAFGLGLGMLWISFIIVFVGYVVFPMPDKVRHREMYRAAKGAQYILGIALVAIIIGLFWAIQTASWQLLIGVIMISIAFFALPSFETTYPLELLGIGQQGAAKVGKGVTGIFLVVSILGLIIVLLMLYSAGSLIALIFLGTLGILSIFMGRIPEARSIAGLIIIGALFVSLLTTYPGLFGSTIFGQWWPTIQHYGESLFGPIGNAFSSGTQTLGDAWLMLTNPTAYYAEQQRRAQAGQTEVTTGGTTKAIEFGELQTVVSSIDPDIPLTGFLEVKNSGTFPASDVNIKMLPPTTTDPVSGEEINLDSLCVDPQDYKIRECSYPGTRQEDFKTCTWDSMDPGIGGSLSFEYDFSGCRNTYGGKYAKVGFESQFSYNVNVSLGIDIMNTTLLQSKLINKEITQKAVDSQYSGGPIKIGIWTPKQPLGLLEEVFIVISATNTGRGEVASNPVYSLYIPGRTNYIDPTYLDNGGRKIMERASNCRAEEVEPEFVGGEDYIKIVCTLSKDNLNNAEKGKMDSKSLFLKYNIGVLDQKNFILVGKVDYSYKGVSVTKELQFPFVTQKQVVSE